MKPAKPVELRLGSNVIELLLRQRRPFLMVDQVRAIELAGNPVLHTSRHISANEPVFDGHFPDLHIWPGTMTVEGMGQSSALLVTLLAIRDGHPGDGDAWLESLRNLDRGYRLHPGYDSTAADVFAAGVGVIPRSLTLGASADVKFVRPVFAGQRLDFRTAVAGIFGDVQRFECEASVDGVVVATGALTGARVPAPSLPKSLG